MIRAGQDRLFGNGHSSFSIEPTGAIVLSYASQDAEAAQRISESLREAGHEERFDESDLRGGDAFDASIRKPFSPWVTHSAT